MDKRVVHFQNCAARYAVVYPDLFEKLPLNKIKKLFDLMLTDANDEAIQITQETLEELIEETRVAWAQATCVFRDGYRDIKFHTYPPNEKRKIKAENGRLLSAVKRAKKTHERINKLFSIFQDARKKYKY